jgi:hypothetical protein
VPVVMPAPASGGPGQAPGSLRREPIEPEARGSPGAITRAGDAAKRRRAAATARYRR